MPFRRLQLGPAGLKLASFLERRGALLIVWTFPGAPEVRNAASKCLALLSEFFCGLRGFLALASVVASSSRARLRFLPSSSCFLS